MLRLNRMYHSPTKQYDSNPDVNETGVTLRKRNKHDEDVSATIKVFTETILSKLDTLKIDFDDKISQIKDSINTVIKQDISKLKDTVMEMKSDINCIREDYRKINTNIQDLHKKQTVLEKEMISLKESTQFTSDEQDTIKKRILTLSSTNKNVEEMRRDMIELKKQNTELRIDINYKEQMERILNLEIVGLPEDKNENLMNIIIAMGNQFGVQLEHNDIIQANRVTPKIKIQGRPRVIVAKMRTRLLKDNLLSASRKRRITTTDIHLKGECRPIYINEHLTVQNKQLLKKAKETAKKREFLYAWTKNGRIFVRKGDTSPPILISTEEDLRRIV